MTVKPAGHGMKMWRPPSTHGELTIITCGMCVQRTSVHATFNTGHPDYGFVCEPCASELAKGGARRVPRGDLPDMNRQAGNSSNTRSNWSGTGKSSLDDNAVRIIRKRVAQGVQGKVMAEIYGVSQGTITDIVKRRTWQHVE